MTLTIVRWITLVFVCGSAALAPSAEFDEMWLALGLSHFMFSAWASRRRFAELSRAPQSARPLVALIGVCSVVYYFRLPSPAIMGLIHHGLNEAYIFPQWYRERCRQSSALAGSRLIFNLLVYAFLARHHTAFNWISWHWLALALALSGAVMAHFLWNSRADISRRAFLDCALFEASAIFPLALSLFVVLSAPVVTYYHFAFWLFYPLFELERAGRGGQLRFLAIMAVGFALARFAIPQPFRYPFFLLVGYFHIGLSLALSSMNPMVVRWAFGRARLTSRPGTLVQA